VREFMAAAAEICALDRGLLDAIWSGTIGDDRVRDQTERTTDAIARLVDAGRREGSLRRSIEADDILPLVAAAVHAGGPASASPGTEKWRRYLEVVLDGLAVPQPIRRLAGRNQSD
jgi:hypothetical protein